MMTANVPTPMLIDQPPQDCRAALEREYIALFPDRSPHGLSDHALAFAIFMDAAEWSLEVDA